jgi:regulator of CtrA degradation
MEAAHSFALMLKRIDALYTDALLLADEVRTYFDDTCRSARDALPPRPRVLFSCEALKVTTRLMHIVAWLLAARADADALPQRLSPVEWSDPEAIADLPEDARTLILASQDLYLRVSKLERQLLTAPIPSPVTQMLSQLQAAF